MVTLATTMAGATVKMYKRENCYPNYNRKPQTLNPNSSPPPTYPGHPG